MEQEKKTEIFHDFAETNNSKGSSSKAIILFIIVILLGIGAGYFLSHGKTSTMTTNGTAQPGGAVVVGAVYGSNDTKAFPDSATGTLQPGGVDGEGQFHLVRPGGDSQNVYLTSSLVDMSQFVGRKVKVNGATQTAKTAGWLMDVGRVEVIQ